MNKVKNNFLYNIIYQLLILVIPLITAPYLSRVIGAKGVGIYSYTYSVVYYFMLLVLLGVNNYGNRSIAKVRDNRKELSKTFWSIYLFQLFMGLIMVLLYVIYILLFNNTYKTIALIEVLFIISAMIDINWFYFGLEEFKVTITRNTCIKVFSVILIFIFVKNESDLWKYTLIMAVTTVLSQFVLWAFVRKKVDFIKISRKDILKHIKPNLVLFIPVIAVSLYKIMDKIMLGSMSNVTEVGYYENAEKIISIPLTFITALGTVMLPRVSNILANGEKKKASEYISKSISFVMFLSFAMCFGLMATGYHFAPIYFGKSFQKTGILIMMLSVTLPFLSFANVLRTQYLIPSEKDKTYIISVSLGAIVNLIMNLICIPKYASIGACIGTIMAEFTVMFYQTISVRKTLNVEKYMVNIIPFFVKAFVMFLVIYGFNYVNMNNVVRILFQVLLGGFIYFILNYQYINSVINISYLFTKYRKKA